jgi:toxin ParE1/3/4
MKSVRFTPKAVKDIREYAAWIRKESPTAALKFLEAVKLTGNTVSRTPGIGSRRYADITFVSGVRMIKVKGFEKYLLFYLEHENSIDVIRLLHGARNIPDALQS